MSLYPHAQDPTERWEPEPECHCYCVGDEADASDCDLHGPRARALEFAGTFEMDDAEQEVPFDFSEAA